MIVTNTLAFVPEIPTIDVTEARWASGEIAALIDHLGADSPVSMVLRHARRQLASLTASGPAAGSVVGPFRIAA